MCALKRSKGMLHAAHTRTHLLHSDGLKAKKEIVVGMPAPSGSYRLLDRHRPAGGESVGIGAPCRGGGCACHDRALDARAGGAHSPLLLKEVLARNELVLGVVVTVPVSRRAGPGWTLDVALACPGLHGRRARWCRWARRSATCLGDTRTAARSRDLRSIWAHPPSPIPSTGSGLPSLVRGRSHPICHGL